MRVVNPPALPCVQVRNIRQPLPVTDGFLASKLAIRVGFQWRCFLVLKKYHAYVFKLSLNFVQKRVEKYTYTF
jgi:hypothetical protein